jgi:hypothetical protein
VRTAIDAMVNGEVKTIADAARSAGLSREHLSRELSKPHIAEHMRQRVVRALSVASAAPALGPFSFGPQLRRPQKRHADLPFFAVRRLADRGAD